MSLVKEIVEFWSSLYIVKISLTHTCVQVHCDVCCNLNWIESFGSRAYVMYTCTTPKSIFYVLFALVKYALFWPMSTQEGKKSLQMQSCKPTCWHPRWWCEAAISTETLQGRMLTQYGSYTFSCHAQQRPTFSAVPLSITFALCQTRFCAIVLQAVFWIDVCLVVSFRGDMRAFLSMFAFNAFGSVSWTNICKHIVCACLVRLSVRLNQACVQL